MSRFLYALALTLSLTAAASAQARLPRPPVIDVHIHSTNTPPSALARLDSLGVRYFVLAGLASDLRSWQSLDTSRYLPSLVFPCPQGRAPVAGRPCFDPPSELPDTAWLRGELRAGRIRAFGELSPQFLGMSPADARLEPYWALAEEFDIPVGVHMGPGPAGAAYESSPAPFKTPEYRAALTDPMLLEEVLLRHRKLRLFVMHAGWPHAESMIALLYAHPNVYVDLAALSSERIMPRVGYGRYLRSLVEAGFAKRIMFGSDFPDQVRIGVDAILAADFLTDEAKADILCNNAMRFLRRPATTCAP